MKKLITATILGIVSITANAKGVNCDIVGTLSKHIMEARQRNVPMQKAMSIIDTKSEALNTFVKTLVIKAYNEPRYNNNEYRQNAVTDFQNEIYSACVKNQSD